MPCSCSSFCDTASERFNAETAAAEMKQYLAKGEGNTTRLIRSELERSGLIAGTLLDIGAGIGALTFALLDRGVTQAVTLDASAAYVETARAEAERRRLSDRVRFVHADFVESAEAFPPASLVTLDRVVCCFPAVEPLLRKAVDHAQRAIALSYPRGRWYVRAGTALENVMRRKTSFRTFVHPPARIERVIREAGFDLISRRTTFIWAVDVFARVRD
jgi:tRNA1(Val) A37 N6-methylase TrmN6